MKTLPIVFGAGNSIPFQIDGTYFEIITSTNSIDVQFLKGGSVVSIANGISAGFFAKPDGGFDALNITSATAQDIEIFVGAGEGGYHRVSGAVSVSNKAGTHTGSQKSVTNADQAILAANAVRNYLFVQNNSAAGVLRVMTDGTAATATKGIRLQPGQSFEPIYIPTGAIHAFMETADATANNVEIIEG